MDICRESGHLQCPGRNACVHVWPHSESHGTTLCMCTRGTRVYMLCTHKYVRVYGVCPCSVLWAWAYVRTRSAGEPACTQAEAHLEAGWARCSAPGSCALPRPRRLSRRPCRTWRCRRAQWTPGTRTASARSQRSPAAGRGRIALGGASTHTCTHT